MTWAGSTRGSLGVPPTPPPFHGAFSARQPVGPHPQGVLAARWQPGLDHRALSGRLGHFGGLTNSPESPRAYPTHACRRKQDSPSRRLPPPAVRRRRLRPERPRLWTRALSLVNSGCGRLTLPERSRKRPTNLNMSELLRACPERHFPGLPRAVLQECGVARPSRSRRFEVFGPGRRLRPGRRLAPHAARRTRPHRRPAAPAPGAAGVRARSGVRGAGAHR